MKRCIELGLLICALLAPVGAGAEVVIAGEDSSGQGYSKTLDFAPELCATDPGEAIVARLPSGMAFAFPLAEYISLDARGFEPSPDETEPWGCPGNPVQIHGARFALHYQAVWKNRQNPDLGLGGLYHLRIIGNNRRTESQPYDVKWFDEIRAMFGNCTTTKESLQLCYLCLEDPLRPGFCVSQKDAGESSDGRALARAGFVALDPANPAGPGGLAWTASCGSEWSNGARFCDTVYTLIDGLSVSYRFGATGFDVDRMREVDLAVRQRVLNLRVPQYDGEDLR